jgi:hypothetical protein
VSNKKVREKGAETDRHRQTDIDRAPETK